MREWIRKFVMREHAWESVVEKLGSHKDLVSSYQAQRVFTVAWSSVSSFVWSIITVLHGAHVYWGVCSHSRGAALVLVEVRREYKPTAVV